MIREFIVELVKKLVHKILNSYYVKKLFNFIKVWFCILFQEHLLLLYYLLILLAMIDDVEDQTERYLKCFIIIIICTLIYRMLVTPPISPFYYLSQLKPILRFLMQEEMLPLYFLMFVLMTSEAVTDTERIIRSLMYVYLFFGILRMLSKFK